jgi:hypothetical protein
MKVLFVTPVEQGAGETITAQHMAENLVAEGHSVLFLASQFACRFVEKQFARQTWQLGQDGVGNRRMWERALRDFRPDVVVFADYPLMFWEGGVSPLAAEPGWVESLDELDACPVTLDHFGFAQREMGVFFGPAHLSFSYQRFPAIPRRMRILIPCPMHEPTVVEGRKGEPFRYWDVPLKVPESVRLQTRRQYLGNEDGLLIFHSVPNWAWQAAEAFGIPFYQFLPVLLDEYLGKTSRPTTIVSVNNGRLLAPPPGSKVRFINLSPIPTPEFEALMFSSDLMITENKVSISLGKACCGLQPCAVLKNSYRLLELLERVNGKIREVIMAMESIKLGSVYKYEVFPSGMTDMLDGVILYQDNSLTKAFCEVEIFGGEETAAALNRLLTDPQMRDNLRARQQVYIDNLQKLNDSVQVLTNLAEEHGRKH